MNIYDLFAFFNANRGHVPRRIPPSNVRTLPGPVEGREWAQQRREKLLEAPKADKRARARSNRISVGKFLLGTNFRSERTNVATGWWFGIYIFFLFKSLPGEVFFQFWLHIFLNLD